jgi:hypothetical protein
LLLGRGLSFGFTDQLEADRAADETDDDQNRNDTFGGPIHNDENVSA